MPDSPQSPDHPPEGPTCHCLLFVDDIVQYAVSGKIDLRGIIGAIGVRTLPGPASGICLFARFINVLGERKVYVTFAHASSPEDPLWKIEATLKPEHGPGSGPLDAHTLALPIPPFEVKRAGEHLLTVWYNGSQVTTTPAHIVELRSSDESE